MSSNPIETCREQGVYIKTAADADPIYMPLGFNYVPYVPVKRTKTTQTIKGSFTQRSLPLFNHGNGIISWEVPLTTRQKAQQVIDLYTNVNLYLLEFYGKWNDSYYVEFTKLEEKTAQLGGYVGLSGEFRVSCVITETNFSCTTTPAP